MLDEAAREKHPISLQEKIGAFLAEVRAAGNLLLLFFLLPSLSLLFGLVGSALCFAVITHFSLTLFSLLSLLHGFLMVGWSLNFLTFVWLGKRVMKDHTLPQMSEYTSGQRLKNRAWIIGLLLCPLLLPLVAWLQPRRDAR